MTVLNEAAEINCETVNVKIGKNKYSVYVHDSWQSFEADKPEIASKCTEYIEHGYVGLSEQPTIGLRTIYKVGKPLDVLFDRATLPDPKQDVKTIKPLIAVFNKLISVAYVDGGNENVYYFERNGHGFLGTPRSSFGYFYISIFKLP